MTDVGTPFTDLQGRILGAYRRYHDFSENSEGEGLALYASANATATEDPTGAAVFNGINQAGEWAAAAVAPRAAAATTGLVIAQIPWAVLEQFADIDAKMEIGFISRDPEDGVLNDYACFRPDQGENVSGNIQVSASGTVTNGQVDYGSINLGNFINDNMVITAIILDFDGGETRFYFQQNPYFDDPTATISSVPDAVTPIGIHIFDTTTDQEEIDAAFAQVLYVL